MVKQQLQIGRGLPSNRNTSVGFWHPDPRIHWTLRRCIWTRCFSAFVLAFSLSFKGAGLCSIGFASMLSGWLCSVFSDCKLGQGTKWKATVSLSMLYPRKRPAVGHHLHRVWYLGFLVPWSQHFTICSQDLCQRCCLETHWRFNAEMFQQLLVYNSWALKEIRFATSYARPRLFRYCDKWNLVDTASSGTVRVSLIDKVPASSLFFLSDLPVVISTSRLVHFCGSMYFKTRVSNFSNSINVQALKRPRNSSILAVFSANGTAFGALASVDSTDARIVEVRTTSLSKCSRLNRSCNHR